MGPRTTAHSTRVVARASGWLIANTLAGSLAGFAFWVIAARTLSPAMVGLGAAYLAAITFLAALSELGMGTVLVRFAPGMDRAEATALVNTTLTSVILASLLTAVAFIAGTPVWSPELAGLAGSLPLAGAFVATAALTGLVQLLDRLFIAYERTELAFARNLLANGTRLAAILLVAGHAGASGLLLALGSGALVTSVLALRVFAPRALAGYRARPVFAWGLLHDKAGYALGNHLAILLWSLPATAYPLLVVNLLGPAANARFYLTWMLANLLFVVPTAVFTAAFARAANAGRFDERAYWRLAGILSGGLALPALALAAAGPLLFRLFGSRYGDLDPLVLLLLASSAIPYSLNTALLTSFRIRRRTADVILAAGLAIGLCAALSVLLGSRHELAGIGAGWLLGQLAGLVSASLLHWLKRPRPAGVDPAAAVSGIAP